MFDGVKRNVKVCFCCKVHVFWFWFAILILFDEFSG